MHCSSCKEVIEDVCRDILGITSCSVDVEAGELRVEYEHGDNLVALKKEVDAIGHYVVEL